MAYVDDAANLRVDSLTGQQREPLRAAVKKREDLLALRRLWTAMEANPVLVEDRRQGVDHSWGGLDIRTFLSGEQSAGRFSAHNIVLHGGAGLPAHYHEDAHAFLIVLDGQVELQIGSTVEGMERYGFGYAPPLTRYGFRNRSASPASMMLVYSPAGAERAFAHARATWRSGQEIDDVDLCRSLGPFGFRFDQEPLDNDARTNAIAPSVEFEIQAMGDLEKLREQFYRRRATPRLVRTPPAELEVALSKRSFRKSLLIGDDSGGQAMINLVAGAPGFNAPSHHQPTEEEFFFIAEGAMDVTCGSETKRVGPGAFAFCPRNCTHGFRNPSPSNRARFLTMNSPAGHERSMVAVRKLLATDASDNEINQMSIVGGFVYHGVMPGRKAK